MGAQFEVYNDKSGEFRWRLVHTNGQIIANSGEGYKAKANAIGGIKSVRENVPNAAVEDKTVCVCEASTCKTKSKV
jgi:uncharacterized protein YegP (UPF0339 family)